LGFVQVDAVVRGLQNDFIIDEHLQGARLIVTVASQVLNPAALCETEALYSLKILITFFIARL
jgi:hypothetical protein